MKLFAVVAVALSTLSACGGGGGGSGSGSSTANGSPNGTSSPVVPAIPAVATINASKAFTNFIQTDQTVSLPSNDGSLATANLIVRADESYPFVTNGKSQSVTKTRVLQFQHLDASGRLVRQSLWKFHFDANMLLVGVAYGSNNNGFKECISVASKNELPTSTNSSGIFFSGLRTTRYDENFRAGTYAHYCDPTPDYQATAEWSVVAGAPNPYFCMTLPMGFSTSQVRICTPVDSSGNQSKSLWIRSLNTDGSPAVDYKDTSANRPVEQFSNSVNANDYWYGAVWRPRDGYIYQRYEDTKFSSEQACREQSAIDWKKTWDASNISWTCVHVTSK